MVLYSCYIENPEHSDAFCSPELLHKKWPEGEGRGEGGGSATLDYKY